jgi:hypothetical protein
LFSDGKEYFVDYERYPEFKNATISQILNVKRLDPSQFHWEDLEVDLDIRSLERPEEYPLKYRK